MTDGLHREIQPRSMRSAPVVVERVTSAVGGVMRMIGRVRCDGENDEEADGWDGSPRPSA